MIRALARPAATVAAAALGAVLLAASPALAASSGPSDPGLFGASDPTFDGVYRQSLALLAFADAGVTPPAASVEWLRDQQCADGGWQSYRADVAVACKPSSAATFSGPDTNSTGIAVQALAALHLQPKVNPDAFLASTQTSTGGFGFYLGADPDPNSTALVVQALIARGEDPHAASWSKGGKDGLSYLVSQQVLSCSTPTEVGGFQSPFSGGHADTFASLQSVPGVAGKAFPLASVSALASPPSTTCASGPSPAPQPAPADAAGAAQLGAGYIDTLIGSDGSVHGLDGKANVSNTAYAVLALSAAQTGDDAKRRNAASWLLSNGVPAAPNPATDNPGELGLVVLANLSVGDAAAAHSARISSSTVSSILARIAATARVAAAATPTPTPTATPTPTVTAEPTETATPIAVPVTLPATGSSDTKGLLYAAITLLAAGSMLVRTSSRLRPAGRRRR